MPTLNEIENEGRSDDNHLDIYLEICQYRPVFRSKCPTVINADPIENIRTSLSELINARLHRESCTLRSMNMLKLIQIN